MRDKPKIGIIQFPGTNCERETAMAVERAGMEPIHYLWNQPQDLLRSFDGYIIAGGFSYEDRSRSGIIAALDPIIPIIREESEQGKPILGICNGAQILVESGMVPGFADYTPGMGLTTNKRIIRDRVAGTGFYNAWVHLRREKASLGKAFSSSTDHTDHEEIMRIPAAHAEGRFVIPQDILKAMNRLGMIAFRYVDQNGKAEEQFPVNPNGSVENIAGVTNPFGSILALMPHPERSPAGDSVFFSMRSYIQDYRKRLLQEEDIPGKIKKSREQFASYISDKKTEQTRGIEYRKLPRYTAPQEAETLLVDTIITDNEAVSVENALRQLKIPLSVQRRVHWEISFQESLSRTQRETLLQNIHSSGELYNKNKEFAVSKEKTGSLETSTSGSLKNKGKKQNQLEADASAAEFDGSELAKQGQSKQTASILVIENEDIPGQHKREALADWFALEGIQTIQRAVLWTFTADTSSSNSRSDRALETGTSTSTKAALKASSVEGAYFSSKSSKDSKTSKNSRISNTEASTKKSELGNSSFDSLMQRMLETHIIMNPYAHQGYVYQQTSKTKQQ